MLSVSSGKVLDTHTSGASLTPYHREGSSLNQVLQQEAQRCKTQGTVIILSDFMDARGYEKGLKAWCGKGMEVHAFMILSPEELEPTLRGDLRLVDCEDALPGSDLRPPSTPRHTRQPCSVISNKSHPSVNVMASDFTSCPPTPIWKAG